jgi:hypothetical protein
MVLWVFSARILGVPMPAAHRRSHSQSQDRDSAGADGTVVRDRA